MSLSTRKSARHGSSSSERIVYWRSSTASRSCSSGATTRASSDTTSSTVNTTIPFIGAFSNTRAKSTAFPSSSSPTCSSSARNANWASLPSCFQQCFISEGIWPTGRDSATSSACPFESTPTMRATNRQGEGSSQRRDRKGRMRSTYTQRTRNSRSSRRLTSQARLNSTKRSPSIGTAKSQSGCLATRSPPMPRRRVRRRSERCTRRRRTR